MNRIFSAVAALVIVAGLFAPAKAAGSCSGYLAASTCVLSQNLVDTGVGTALAGPLSNAPTYIGSPGGAAFGISTGTTISYSSQYLLLTSTGGTVTLAVTPNIATTTALGVNLPYGSFIVLSSSVPSAGVALQANGTLSGSLVYLGAASRLINNKNTWTGVLGPDGFWHEISFTTGQ